MKLNFWVINLTYFRLLKEKGSKRHKKMGKKVFKIILIILIAVGGKEKGGQLHKKWGNWP